MKKTLKIIGITLASLLLLLILIPIAFKGKIKGIVIAQGNKMLNAEFYFETVNISLIRNFPKATVTIKELDLWGKGDFANDTLISAGSISATVNIMSIFGDKGFDISRVSIDNTSIRAIVLEDGRPNWDIMKPSEEPQEEQQSDQPSDMKINLQRFSMSNIDLVYDDRQSKSYAYAENLDFRGSGDLSAKQTRLKIDTEIERIGFRQAGVALLSDAYFKLKTELDANLEQMRFKIRDNSIALNAITASVEGEVAIEEDWYDIDLTLNSGKIEFKELLSMVPAIYSKEFKSLKASGEVQLSAWAKGRMQGESLPAFDLSLNVINANFQYPSLPKGVDQINVVAEVKNPGGVADKTTINIDPLRLRLAGNPIEARLALATPISDMSFDAAAKGVLNLGSIKEVYPLDGMELNGRLNADFSVKGRMSHIEKEQYDRVAASGSLAVSDMLLKMDSMPDITIHKSLFTFTPQYLNLSETTVTMGKSDITADCKLENYIGFALKGQSIKGNLNLHSNLLDLNEIMGHTPSAPEVQDTTSMSAPKVPSNINFNMQVSLKKVLYDNLTLDNVLGQVIISNSKLDMRNLSFNALGGAVVANGYYSTADGVERPELKASFNMNKVSFAQTLQTFMTIKKMAPIFESLKGNFSGAIALDTRFDSAMNPVYNTLNGNGEITTENINLSGIKTLDQIADAIKKPELKDINVKDLRVAFTIVQGRIHTKPFDIKMGATNMKLSGSTGIDQTIDYTGAITLPESTGIGKLTTLDLKVGGTFSSPKVSVDVKGMAEQAVKEAAKEVIGGLSEKLGIDLSDAKARREALIDTAQRAGDKLVEVAQTEADKVVQRAGDNIIMKKAAQLTAKAMVEEAEKQSRSLVDKATAEGDKILKRAEAGEPIDE